MINLSSTRQRLSVVLWITAVHSFCVGVGLVIQIREVMQFFGYGACTETFFPAQGGVFHIVMAVGYALAAYDPNGYRCLASFSVFVKAAATLFLFIYYFFFESIWSVLVSGIGDGLLMAIIWLTLAAYRRSPEAPARKKSEEPCCEG